MAESAEKPKPTEAAPATTSGQGKSETRECKRLQKKIPVCQQRLKGKTQSETFNRKK